MINVCQNVVATKNTWLFNQIDVAFPTEGSLQGHQLQHERSQRCNVIAWVPSEVQVDCSFDLFPVTFHRLTIYFAVLQSKMYAPTVQESIVEFFTQIIYSEPCQLYLGFKDNVPVFAGMITRNDNQILFSNIVTTMADMPIHHSVNHLYTQLSDFEKSSFQFFLEDNPSMLVKM